eukprot:6184736-Amphidinium_carterae.1
MKRAWEESPDQGEDIASSNKQWRRSSWEEQPDIEGDDMMKRGEAAINLKELLLAAYKSGQAMSAKLI